MKTNIFNAISKIRYLALLMVLTTISSHALGAEGDVLKTYNTASTTFTTGYKRQAGDNFVWWGQKGYYGANNATNHGKLLPTDADLPVVKAQNSSATTSTTGLYYLYTSEAVANVGAIEINFTAKSGSSTVNAYIVSSSTAAASGSATWTKVTLSSSSAKAQGVNCANSGTYTFTFNATETSAKYYGVVFVTSAYWRASNLTMKLIEGAAGSSCDKVVTLTKAAATNGSFTLNEGSASGTAIASGGTVDNCDANAIVYIVPTPSTGYKVNGTPTATNSASVTADGSNYKITYTKGASKASTVTVNFTAQSYTVTLNKNSGTGGTSSVSATYNATCPTIASAPTREGYTFGGYYTGSGGTGTKVVNADLTWVASVSGYTDANKKWIKAAATTLYANWVPNVYTVTWKVNGVTYSTGSPSTSVNHGEKVATLPTAPSPASYCGDKFIGWTTTESYDAASAPSTLFTAASGAPTATGNQVFYAVFGYYEE